MEVTANESPMDINITEGNSHDEVSMMVATEKDGKGNDRKRKLEEEEDGDEEVVSLNTTGVDKNIPNTDTTTTLPITTTTTTTSTTNSANETHRNVSKSGGNVTVEARDDYVHEIAIPTKPKSSLDVNHSIISVLAPLHEAEIYHEDNSRASLILAQHQRIIGLEQELIDAWDLVEKLRLKLQKYEII